MASRDDIMTSLKSRPTLEKYACCGKATRPHLHLLQNLFEVSHVAIGDHGNGGAGLVGPPCPATPATGPTPVRPGVARRSLVLKDSHVKASDVKSTGCLCKGK